MRLNGWQRIWVVFSVISFIGALAAVSVGYVAPEDVKHSDDFYFELPESSQAMLVFARKKDTLGERIEERLAEARRRRIITETNMPNGHTLIFRKEVETEMQEIVKREYWAIVKGKSNERNFVWIKIVFAMYFSTMFTIYFLGWSFGWVYRGFKSP